MRGPMAGNRSLRRLSLFRNFLDRVYRQKFEPTNLRAPYFDSVEAAPEDSGTRVCLYALSQQPEAMTLGFAEHEWENPVYCLDKLLTLLPSNWEVWVRPHPNQVQGFRSVLFWKIVQSSERVRVVESRTPSSEFMRAASLVATINGTIGWEAIKLGIPVLHFGSAWYQEFPGAVHVDAVESVGDLPRPNSWTVAQIKDSLRQFSKQMAPGFVNHLDYVSARDAFQQQIGTQDALGGNREALCASVIEILDAIDHGAAVAGIASTGVPPVE